MGKTVFTHAYESIISVENLLLAWKEFAQNKKKRKDVQKFEHYLMANILLLNRDLVSMNYRHSPYDHFVVLDPKRRDIHKASVCDRIVHRALYRGLYPFFDRAFIADSYSCRVDKGTHRAMNRFRVFAYKASKNHTQTCFVLKCDIRKFFASIDHKVLFSIISVYIRDADIHCLIKNIVASFSSGKSGVGLPLGNLTSQLFVNIYMNEFDQFVKHKLKIRYYIRYADDFVILDEDRAKLLVWLKEIEKFLQERLKLSLHHDKVFIKTLASGVDFLGWVHFPHHRVLRTTTKRRMFRRLQGEPNEKTVASYLGLLRHGNSYNLAERILKGKLSQE